ncbi:HEAT repeat domain-containing protein [Lewinella sp. W8]|uniref:HEAT repeat domain-containing protein n=1 Tax=Lewinella sp. W8 TaxID=2528208 RepID=UPI0010672AD3|nr:HEAT repeat domain-containing protein [Lewinella sp. W8]MTB52764.1 hypothetical protein [Lewinella sp. W8]
MDVFDTTDLIDYLGGELSTERHRALEARLATDEALREELADLRALQSDIRAIPEPRPSAAADTRFAEMLAREQAKLATTSTTPNHGQPPARVRRLPQWAAAAAILLLAFAGGWLLRGAGQSDTERQLAAARELMLDLMKDDRSSKRMQATTVTLDLPVADPTVIENLAYLLQNDENPNVRLAALDALRRFSDLPQVREELLRALETSPPEVLRFELIETLVQLEEKRVLPILEEMIDADSLPQPVRDAAQMASFKLI